jgi:uncharacterized iron-regulated membrane protein
MLRISATAQKAKTLTKRRSDRIRQLHRWFGLALVLPIALIALTGTLLLFRDEIFIPTEWRNAAPTALATADSQAIELLNKASQMDLDSAQLARGARGFHQLSLRNGVELYWLAGAAEPEMNAPWLLSVEKYVLELHDYLLLGSFGDLLVRVFGPLLVVQLLVGIWSWWPNRHGWRFKDLEPSLQGRAHVIRSHLAVGSVGAILLLVHATTGALMANNPSLRAWLKPYTPAVATDLPFRSDLSFASHDFAAAVHVLRKVFPRGEITQVSTAGDGKEKSIWTVKLRLPGEKHPNGRSTVTLDFQSGRIAAIRDARLAGVPGLYDDLLFPLHTGTLFGWANRWLWLAGALILFWTALLGTCAYATRRAKNNGEQSMS